MFFDLCVDFPGGFLFWFGFGERFEVELGEGLGAGGDSMGDAQG